MPVRYAPLLHWIKAAIWANHTPKDFFEQSGDYQAVVLAAYETSSQIDSAIAYEQAKQNNKKK